LIVRDRLHFQKPESIAYRANNVVKFASAKKSLVTVFIPRTGLFRSCNSAISEFRRT
jgi:hypothetical protein